VTDFVIAVLHPHGVADASFWLVVVLALLWTLAHDVLHREP